MKTEYYLADKYPNLSIDWRRGYLYYTSALPWTYILNT